MPIVFDDEAPKKSRIVFDDEAAPAPQQSFAEKYGLRPQDFGRSAAIAGRSVFDAATAIPGAAADVAWDIKNRITGSNSPLPTQVLNRDLNSFMPQETSVMDKVLRTVPGMLMGAKMPLPGVKNQPNPVLGQASVDDIASQPLPKLTRDGFAADQSALTQAQRGAAEGGEALGMRMTPGQRTGSRFLQQIEAKLESQPMTSGPFNTLKANNARVLARSGAKAIGEQSDEVSSATLDKAATRLGEAFESVRDARVRPIDADDFLKKVSDISGEFEGLANVESHPLVTKLLGFATNGNATGKQLGDLSSKLGKAATQQMTSPSGDRQMGMALSQVKDYVDDLVEVGLDAGEKAAYADARSQYRNLLLLTQRTGVINPSTGNLSGANLASLLQQKDKAGFLYGRNNSDLYNAARFSQAFKPIVGDSGTATRLPIQGISDLLLRAPGTVASGAYLSRPSQKAIELSDPWLRQLLQAKGLVGGAAPLLPQLSSE